VAPLICQTFFLKILFIRRRKHTTENIKDE
jgi:hypothetical protein